MRLGDLDALKKEFAKITYTRFTADMGQGGFEMFSEKEIEDIIDKAPTVDIKDQIAGAYNEGYMCGNKEAEKARPQGDNKEALFVLNHLLYDCDNMTHKEYDILREAIMKGGAE